MINKIKRLKSIGKFYDYAAKGNLLEWHKNSFLLAPNAYGKSTLVNVLRSLRDNDPKIVRARRTLGSAASPEAVIIADGENYVFDGTKWNKPYPQILIFDAPYIHDNILSQEVEHGHKKSIHKIIIGAQGVTLANELSDLKEAEKSKGKELKGLTDQFTKGAFTQHTLESFLAIPDGEQAAVQARIQKLEQEAKSKQAENIVRGLGFPHPLSFSDFDLSKLKVLASRKLQAVHESAEKQVLQHIERNIKDKADAKEFIRRGLALLQADCPFCGQDLTNAAELLKAYQDFFDEAFREYQKELQESSRALANWNIQNSLTALVSAHNANAGLLKQWEQFVTVEMLPGASSMVDAAMGKLIDLKGKVQAELERKQKDPNADVDISQLDSLDSEVRSVRSFVETYNQRITEFTEKAKLFVSNLAKSDIESIRAALDKEREIEKRFQPAWSNWAADFTEAKKQLSDAIAARELKQLSLENYTKTLFDAYQKRINELLTTLGADFEITELAGKTDARANESYSEFGLLILKRKVPLTARQDDAACFKNTLSEGDKSTLAFAFFIAALEKTAELEKQVVILDDPLSSLDETRRERTARVLLDLSPKLNQLCVFTHKRDFLEKLFDKIPD
jgi:wobble nucleotide-excising tRNase